MNILPLLTATQRRNFFNTLFNSQNGVNKLATLFDVNNVINILNQDFYQYKVLDLSVTQVGIENPSYVTRANAIGIEPCENACGFQNPCCGGQTKAEDKTSAIFLRTAPGVYTFTFTATPGYSFFPAGIADIHFSVSPFAIFGQGVTIAKVPTADNYTVQYTITTYNAAGVPADGILHDTIIAMKIYPIYP